MVAGGGRAPNRIVLRVAPFAAVPYGRFLDTLCVGCLQPCDASVPRCSRCGVARHCASCAASFAGRAHAHECHAYERLKRNERGLTLEHDDLRLLLRVLSRRRQSIDDESSRGVRVVTRDDDTQEENRSSPQESHDPFLVAAAKDSDVIVDTFDDLDALMSGAGDDDDDGRTGRRRAGDHSRGGEAVQVPRRRGVPEQRGDLRAAARRSYNSTGLRSPPRRRRRRRGFPGRENGDEEKATGEKQRSRAEDEGKINAAVCAKKSRARRVPRARRGSTTAASRTARRGSTRSRASSSRRRVTCVRGRSSRFPRGGRRARSRNETERRTRAPEARSGTGTARAARANRTTCSMCPFT